MASVVVSSHHGFRTFVDVIVNVKKFTEFLYWLAIVRNSVLATLNLEHRIFSC